MEMDPEHSDAAALARVLLPRIRRWDSASWTLPAVPGSSAPSTAGSGGDGHGGGPTRAEFVAAAVQRLADVGADAERRPRRPVPRLADVNLADQLAVMVDDILRTGDPAATGAAAIELAALRTALGYR